MIESCDILSGYTIPKGWKVFACFRAVHLDHEHFKDARTFDPWRWQVRYYVRISLLRLPELPSYQNKEKENVDLHE